MRHLNSGSKLGKQPAHRRAVLRSLVTNLFEHGRITTTLTRAKAARPVAEKMITLGKRDTLQSRRMSASVADRCLRNHVHSTTSAAKAPIESSNESYAEAVRLATNAWWISSRTEYPAAQKNAAMPHVQRQPFRSPRTPR